MMQHVGTCIKDNNNKQNNSITNKIITLSQTTQLYTNRYKNTLLEKKNIIITACRQNNYCLNFWKLRNKKK